MNNKDQIIPIKEQPKEIVKKDIKLNIKQTSTKNINKLPEWSIEPPLEINRSAK